MSLRVREKTDIMYESRAKTLADPRGFLVELFYKEGMHLKENKAFNNSDGATLSFWDRIAKSGNDKIGEVYASFLSKMIAYWQEEGYAVKCDEKGLISAGLAAGILFSNSHMMPGEYFEAIYRAFCEAEVDRFFSARGESSVFGAAGYGLLHPVGHDATEYRTLRTGDISNCS